MTTQSTTGSELQLRADVYTSTGRLLKSFDVSAVPVGELAETLRTSMGHTAKETRVVEHMPDVLKGECIMTVDRKSGMVAALKDRFPSRLLLGGKSW